MRSAGVRSYLRHQGIYGYRRDLLLRFVRWKPSPLERAEALEQLRALENGVSIHVVVTAQRLARRRHAGRCPEQIERPAACARRRRPRPRVTPR